MHKRILIRRLEVLREKTGSGLMNRELNRRIEELKNGQGNKEKISRP